MWRLADYQGQLISNLIVAAERAPERAKQFRAMLQAHGNSALEGAVVKTAGVSEDLWRFTGPARVFESQEDAVSGILAGSMTSRCASHSAASACANTAVGAASA